MQWLLHQGDILDIIADVLVCSANVFLNLSGGVGGAFGLRYGPAMQESLHNYLSEHGLAHIHRGAIVEMPPCGSPYRAVLHAVAVDGAYESSADIFADVISAALARAAVLKANTVALAALATGYGRLSMADFAKALEHVMDRPYPPLKRIVLGLRSPSDAEELREIIPELGTLQIVH
jgi:O-acetyl-ADP-ribose deacetylase (regulator of RNase III)